MKKIFLLISFLIIFNSCGFKPINQVDKKNYFVNNITSQGEKRVAYFLKEKILLRSKDDAESKFNVDLKIKKTKEIKEKKISGKISSYKITLKVNLFLENIEDFKKISNNFTKSVSFNVANNHSDTIANEKKATEDLTERISEDIVNFFIIYLNR